MLLVLVEVIRSHRAYLSAHLPEVVAGYIKERRYWKPRIIVSTKPNAIQEQYRRYKKRKHVTHYAPAAWGTNIRPQ